MRVRLKGINSVPKTLADGTRRTYWYAWKGGPPLRGEPGTPEFVHSYNEAIARKIETPRGQLIGVLQAYQASQDFTGLAESTRHGYVGLIRRIEKEFGDFPLSALTDRRTRGIFLAWRDRYAASSGRRQADYAWTVLARILSWGHDRGLVLANRVSAADAFIVELGARSCGLRRTKRCSSNALRRTCTCRSCSRCGPGSGKATSYASPGRPMTARIFGCGRERPARASSFRSAPRSKLHSTRRRRLRPLSWSNATARHGRARASNPPGAGPANGSVSSG